MSFGFLQNRSGTDGHTRPAGDIHQLRVEGNFLIRPGCGVIPEDLGKLQGKGAGENLTAMGFIEPEDKYIDLPTGWVELFLSDIFDGNGC